MPAFLGINYATPLEITSDEVVMRSESLNLKISTFRTDAQRWEIKATLNTSNNLQDSAGARLSVHSTQHGSSKPFNIEMPQLLGTNPVNGTVNVVGVETAGNDEISVSTTGIEKIFAGHFVSFEGNPKVYQVTEDVTINKDGAILKIFPKLVTDVLSSSVVNFAPNIQVYYSKRAKLGVKYTGGIMTKPKVAFTEALV